MAVKLLVMYPRLKDIEAFEQVYNNEHVPMAVDKLVGKPKLSNQGVGLSARDAGLPPHRRSLLSFDASFGGVCRFRGRQTNYRPRGVDLLWRRSNHSRGGRGDIRVSGSGERCSCERGMMAFGLKTFC